MTQDEWRDQVGRLSYDGLHVAVTALLARSGILATLARREAEASLDAITRRTRGFRR